MVSRVISRLKNNQKFDKILTICLVVSFALYIFSIPSFSGRAKLNLISYGLMILSAVFVIAKYVLFEKFTFNKRLLIPCLFALEAFIGTVIYSHAFRHWLTIVLLVVTLIIFYYGFCVIGNKRLIYQIISFSLLGFGVYFAFYYRDAILSLNLDNPLGNYFDNVNTIGTYFSLGSSIFLFLALTSTKKIEWLYLAPSLFLLFLGLFTGSRHFIITTGVAFIATILVGFKKKKWIAALIIVAVIGLFFIIIQLPFLSVLKERIDRGITTLFGIGNAKYDPSTVQRTIWPQYGFNLGGKEMVFGYGADGFSLYSGIGTYSHNTYSEIFCNFGIVGASLFFFTFIYSLLLAFRSKKRSTNFVIVGVVFYLIKGFFGVYFSSKDAYLMIALIMFLTKDVKLGQYHGLFKKAISKNIPYCEVSI